MMRMRNRFLTVLACSLLIGMSGNTAQAKEYSYTITLYAGEKGAIDGKDGAAEVLTGCRAGDRVSFDLSKVTVTDEKYYVKGVRLSGRDNEEVAPAFYVEGDAEYVVAYGIKGNLVSYTVNYQDEDGKTLAESETFYGNLGDKPVVAYQYIEGYVPQALAMTKTLSDNEAENVFTFVYSAETSESIGTQPTGTTTIVNVAGSTGATAGTGEAAGGTATEGIAAADGTDSAEEPGEAGGVNVEEPEELVDLDEIETPTGNVQLEGSNAEETSGIPMVAAGVVGVFSLAALIGLALALRRRMRSK